MKRETNLPGGLLHQRYCAKQSPLCSGRGDLWQRHIDSQSEGSVVYVTHQANRYDKPLCAH